MPSSTDARIKFTLVSALTFISVTSLCYFLRIWMGLSARNIPLPCDSIGCEAQFLGVLLHDTGDVGGPPGEHSGVPAPGPAGARCHGTDALGCDLLLFCADVPACDVQ